MSSLLLVERPRQFLFQLPRHGRTFAPAAGTRHGLHHGHRAGAALDVGSPRHRAARRGHRDRAGGLLDGQRLYSPRVARLSHVAGLSRPRGVPRHRLAVEGHARCARLPHRLGAVLVRCLARPAAIGRRIGPGSAEPRGGNGAMGNQLWHKAAARHPLDAVLGSGCDLRCGSALAGNVQRLSVSAETVGSPAGDLRRPAGRSPLQSPTPVPTGRAGVVDRRKLNELKTPRFNDDVEYLGAYADVIEKGPDAPPSVMRNGTDVMLVRATVQAGQSIVVQESYAPAWQARAGGTQVPVRKDAMGFMVVDAPPGDGEVRLEFVTPLENQVGRIVTLLTLLILVGLTAGSARWERLA